MRVRPRGRWNRDRPLPTRQSFTASNCQETRYRCKRATVYQDAKLSDQGHEPRGIYPWTTQLTTSNASTSTSKPHITQHNTTHHSHNDWSGTAGRHHINSNVANSNSLHHRGRVYTTPAKTPTAQNLSLKTSHILPLVQLAHNRPRHLQPTHWRRVRLPVVSKLPGASTGPGNIKEQASSNTCTSHTVTSALDAAHPRQAIIAMGSMRLGRPAKTTQRDRQTEQKPERGRRSRARSRRHAYDGATTQRRRVLSLHRSRGGPGRA